MHYAILFSCLGAFIAIVVWAFVIIQRRRHLYFNQKLISCRRIWDIRLLRILN
jgi:hypothetical protein